MKASTGPPTIEKIRNALKFMRNQRLELPFIDFQREEYIQLELTINDLWRVKKFDEQWTELQSGKRRTLLLFEDTYNSARRKSINECMSASMCHLYVSSILRDNDRMERLKEVQSVEELRDVYSHFLLHCVNEL